ncbi:MAG: DNA translocase FtsK 4TM domain-containing protein [Candidatus Parcubacteria bacterium]|nr:DNA translocase FtsK 4TM domain-containing protein [Candidatus Parcubacteria bacterium]
MKNNKNFFKDKNGKKQFLSKRTEIHPDTRRWIFIIFLFALAGISLLGLFNLAGKAGLAIDSVLTLFLGWAKIIFPIVLVIWGYALLDKRYKIKTISYLGLFLFILSFTALLHLFIPVDEAILAVDQGRGGGYIGLFLSYSFLNIMGLYASFIAILAIFIISILLILNTSVEDLKESRTILGRIILRLQIWYYHLKLKFAKNEQEEAEAIETEQAVPGGEEGSSLAETGEVEDKDIAFASKKLNLKEAEAEEIQLEKPKIKRIFKKVDLPLDLLDDKVGKPTAGNIAQNKLIIQKTLESFGIPVEMGEVAVGPTVTQYTLKPAEGIKLSRLTALNDDLALALAAHPLRIEAPIPGRSLVGIEVPNQSVAIVRLRELLASPEFKQRKSSLTIPIGRDVTGKTWVADLGKMPHLLVAGQTGSGKSVALHSVIVSLLYQNGPETLKLIMVDPKRVEMPAYNNIPHLLTPVITDVKKTVNALKWTIAEMDRRYVFLEKFSKRNIDDYNKVVEEKMPFIIFIVDEMADLMSNMGHEVEGLIIRLAQMSRAVGIHLILATQRPSVEVITGLIKANVPARIAFAVASITDSRTILDYSGAEKLIGRGDMLYTCAELSKPKRLQGALVSEAEVNRVVNYLKQSGEKPEYEQAVVEKQTKINGEGEIDFSDPDQGDELFDEAREIILQAGKASTSYIQRRLKVGYSRAARLMDLLEEAGIIGPGDGAKPREILVTEKEVASEPDYEGPEMTEINEEDDVEAEESSYAEASEDDAEEQAEEIEKNNE